MQELHANSIISAASHLSAPERALVERAFKLSQETHGDKKRLSGEPYVVHEVETARILASLHLDVNTIIAGLLHATPGNGTTTIEDIRREFGDDVAYLVKSVDALDFIKYYGDERYAENLRKLLMITAKDIRVLVIRFAHRLHNMRTLGSLPKEKRGRVALETLEIYAPIANRMGMHKLKGDLEDAAFPYVYPEQYEEVRELLKQKSHSVGSSLEHFSSALKKRLVKEGVVPIRVTHRLKQLYSLFRKLQEKDMDIESIYDIAALRVIVRDVGECYRVLGIIHNIWKPVPNRPVKDYIAVPKPNGYRSIHTTVFMGDGNIVEIQIRTEEMDNEAEFGVTSHLAYAESWKPKSGGIIGKRMQWIKQLLEWQQSLSESKDFIEKLKMDFFSDRVFAFTPKGDVIDVPEGATPVDFAYTIHSDIGDHIFGARVNGKLVSLDHPLANGDIVEIQTRVSSSPSHRWLEFAKTSLARKHIKLALLKKSTKKSF